MICSLTMLAASSLLLCFLLKRFIFFIPLTFALVILTMEILSVFGAINPKGIYIINIITFITCFFIWHKNGKNIPKFDIKPFWRRFLNSIKLDKSLFLLFVCLIFMITVSFILCTFMPANEWDSEVYHVVRSVMWSKLGTITHFDTPEIRNLVMPINTEVVYCWIYTLTKSDVGFQFLSFSFYIWSVCLISKILGVYKYSVRQKLWAVILFSSLAGIISQTSSTQSDLVVGSLVLGAIYFILDRKSDINIYFASLCLALATGTKSTGVICSVAVIVWTLFVLKKQGLKFIGYFFLNFLVFSSYNYILNFLDWGNPISSREAWIAHRFWGGVKGAVANYLRYLLQMFDFTGFAIGNYISPYVFQWFNKLLSMLHISPFLGVVVPMTELNSYTTEVTIGFGILGWLCFIPCCIFAIILKSRKLRFFGLLFFINLALLSVSVGYMVYSIRFITAFVTISAPVLVLSYFKKMNPIKFIIILFSIFYLILVSSNLDQKPFFKLRKEQFKYTKEEFSQKTRCFDFSFYVTDKNLCRLKNYLEENYPKNTKVAMFINTDSNISPFYFSKTIDTDFLNAHNFNNYDFSKYDIVIVNNDRQLITAPNDNKCFVLQRLYTPYNKKEPMGTVCAIDYKKLVEKGFNRITKIKTTPVQHSDRNIIQAYYLFSKLK